ncbi:hypothetical protein CUJ83_00770 [Methanocella sp. CWC-04]|uniref:Uncharacterized protein n=1 Tax=Methanooceanicella nereidis TaxID=2052831 RepID=A0AAP2RA49_9EURY|nr:hypothetical protein [Methanocella sp. CWC-04]MCD1293528.1 hypothetical protein [Methanocella sp. CWC-04]
MRQNENLDIEIEYTGHICEDNAESYRIIHNSPHYRIGYGTTTVGENLFSFFVEVTLTLFNERPRVNIQTLEKDLMIIKELHRRGYTLNCHDDACISAELIVSPQKIKSEYEDVKTLIEDILAKNY